jgi:hypothetical protein
LKTQLSFALRVWILSAIGLALSVGGCRAQDLAWTRYFVGHDYVKNSLAVVPAELNSHLIACMTENGGEHARLLLLNDLGDSLWSADVCPGGLVSLRKLPAGGFIAAGWKHTVSGDDALLVRGANREILWSRTYGGSRKDEFTDVQATLDGGFVGCGFSGSFNPDKRRDLFVVRTDSAGDTLWSRVFESPGNQGWFRVVQSPDSGFAVVVTSYIVNTDQPRRIKLCLLRLDENGNRLWERFYGPEYSVESPHFLVQDSGFVICANRQTAKRKDGHCNYRVYLLRLDTHGDTLWTRSYGDERRESLIAGSIVALCDGYLIAGTDGSVAYPFIMKVGLQGDSLWTRRYSHGTNSNYDVAAALSHDGGCVLAAQGLRYDKKKRDYVPQGLVVMKTKPLP